MSWFSRLKTGHDGSVAVAPGRPGGPQVLRPARALVAGVAAVLAAAAFGAVAVSSASAATGVNKVDPCGIAQDGFTLVGTHQVNFGRGTAQTYGSGSYLLSTELPKFGFPFDASLYDITGYIDGTAYTWTNVTCPTGTPSTTTTTTATTPPTTSTTTTKPAKNPTITGITATCTGNGVLTVTNPVAGARVTLGIFYHVPGDSSFHEVSRDYRVAITLKADQTQYPYSVNVTDGYPSNTNTLRVQVIGATGADFGSSVNTKSLSFGPCRPAPTTSTPTGTPSTTTTTTATTPPVTNTTTATTPPTTSTTTATTTATQPPTSTSTSSQPPTSTSTSSQPSSTGTNSEPACADHTVTYNPKTGKCEPVVVPTKGGKSTSPGGHPSYNKPGGEGDHGAQAQPASYAMDYAPIALIIFLLAFILLVLAPTGVYKSLLVFAKRSFGEKGRYQG